MDVAALSLEDAFPELSPEQVRSALAQAMGNLALATSFCDRMLSAANGGGRGTAAGAAVGAGTPKPASRPTSPQHRRWWPAVQVPPGPEQPLVAPAPLAGGVPGPVEGRDAAPPSRPPQLIPVQVCLSSRPAGVRVIQRHSLAGEQEAGPQQGNGPARAAAAAAAKPSQGIHYAGVFLFEDSRDRVLQFAPPLHEAVSADHMTLAYAPSLQQCIELPLGRDAPLFVEGVASDYRAQVLAVQHPSWLPFLSESAPHVTISVAEGVPAKEGGDLVRAAREGSRARIIPLVGVKLLHGRVGVKLTDGTIAYSEEELREGLQALQQRAPPLDTSAPVRILRRGDAPLPRSASPRQQQQQQQEQEQEQEQPWQASPQGMPSAASAAAPAGPAGGAGGAAAGLAAAQEVRVVSFASPAFSALSIESHTSAAALTTLATAAQPSLDDLLDMLHLADSAGSSALAMPSAPRTATPPVVLAKSALSSAAGRPVGTSRANSSSTAGSAGSASTRQARAVGFAAPYRPPGLHARGAAASQDERQRQPLASSPPSAAPPSPQQQQPQLQQEALLSPQPPPVAPSFAELKAEEGASLGLLSALADRLGSQPQPPQSPQQQQSQQPQQSAAPLSSPPSFNPIPRRQQQQQVPVAAGGAPRTPAPTRTLADFLPTSLAAAPPSPQVLPPPLPFFMDGNNPPSTASSPPSTAPATAAFAAQRGGQAVQAGAWLPRRQSSAAGYESSSSSGEMAVPFVPLPQTEQDLQRAFPGIEAEVLSAALEIHGGDASEAASFLTALQLEQQACALASAAAGALASSDATLHTLPSPPQPRQLPPPPQRPPGQRKQGGRGPKQKRGHTGASDPLAVAERQAMSLHLAARNMYEKAARAAAARGKHALAQELCATSHHHAEVSSAARRRANSTAFRTSNTALTNTFKVDLHGLHVEEALQVLERHLVGLGGLGHPGGIILEVVTGVGRHSSAGQPRLLPAVVRFLSDAGYRFDTQEGNTGVVLVFIGC